MVARKDTALSASLEDYLEAILNVADASCMARSKDIAASLGVARPSVTGALKLLAKKGLVNYRPYGYVTLTQAGTAQAARVARKHDIITSFFEGILGVESSVAQKAACRAEHLLGSAIVSRMSDFMDFARKRRRPGVSMPDAFERFVKSRQASQRKNTRRKAN